MRNSGMTDNRAEKSRRQGLLHRAEVARLRDALERADLDPLNAAEICNKAIARATPKGEAK
jgi:hypothetical protein